MRKLHKTIWVWCFHGSDCADYGPSGLWHCRVLQADTDISEKQGYVNRVRNWHFIKNILADCKEGCNWDPQKGLQKFNPIRDNENGRYKNIPFQKHMISHHRKKFVIVREDNTSQASHWALKIAVLSQFPLFHFPSHEEGRWRSIIGWERVLFLGPCIWEVRN